MKVIYLCIVILSIACVSQLTTMHLAEFEKYKFKDRHTSIILLKSFLINRKCNPADSILYGNAFLCKTTLTNDTILVLDLCKPAYKYLDEDYKFERDLNIDTTNISNSTPIAVILNVDKSVLKKKYKYTIAEINKLEY
ncbi:hypothetical protein [Flavihumibacter profundi]|jgi:hypothetical protein|uniref:hypothetical protein n=1 Tax=Flavihumibacter profundi TaxID=2716883 RepID=UPI001CC4096D|nr:hypothetical protein [Flavihumibacter profundi]MBZ5858554.1 hypothetical protein [Flavihumibacter profundi]